MRWFRKRKGNSPESDEEWIERGIELSLNRRFSDGTVAFNHALAISADREKTFESIIHALQSNGFRFEAMRYVQNLYTLNVDNELACSMLGYETSNAKRSRLQAALDVAVHGVREGDAATMLAVANAAEAIGDIEKAYSYTLEALECQRPTDVATVLSLGDLSVRLGRHLEAKRWLSVARFHGAEQRDLLHVEAQSLVAFGEFAAARLVLQDLRDYPGSKLEYVPYAYALLEEVAPVYDPVILEGRYLVDTGRLNDAVDHYAKASVQARNDSVTFEVCQFLLGLALIRFGEQGGIRNDIQELLAIGTTLLAESQTTTTDVGVWLIGLFIEASGSQTGVEFQAYLMASDYEILLRHDLLDSDEILVGLMGREPENAEARQIWERYRGRFV